MRFTFIMVLMILASCNSSVPEPEGISKENWAMIDKAESGDSDSLTQVCRKIKLGELPEASLKALTENKDVSEGCQKLIGKEG